MALLPFSETRDMVWEYLPDLNRSMLRFYHLLLLLAFTGIAVLFMLRVPVSIPATGIIRPAFERTDVRSVAGGTIEKMFVREGDTVAENGLLFLLRNPGGPAPALANEAELLRQQELVQDLRWLTEKETISPSVLQKLRTALYRGQAAAYLSRAEGDNLNWRGARHEADLGRVLVKDKVISPKEFYDQQLRESKMRSAFITVQRNQWAAWQTELAEHGLALTACINRRTEFRSRAEQLEVRSPVAGVVQGLRSWYPGSVVRPEQSLCSVSPEGQLIGECYVPSRDAGLLHPGQKLRIRVDAFNANYFGVLSGRISSISNDVGMIGEKPVFTVRCFLEPGTMNRNNKKNYSGLLRKGLGFQARCIVAERTLFQLLYDNLENWINPVSLTSYSA